MNDLSLAVTGTLTMSSLEISELTGIRHDNAKRTIERLAELNVIQQPLLVETKNHLGQTVEHYDLEKRDSFVVVAQLSPDFTGVLVDRWVELEGIVAESNKPLLKRFSSSDLAYAMNLKHNVTIRKKMAAIAAKMGSLGAKPLVNILQVGVDYDLFDPRLLLPMILVLDKGEFGPNDPNAVALTNFIDRVCGGDLSRLLPPGHSVVQEEPDQALYEMSVAYSDAQDDLKKLKEKALEAERKALALTHPARDQTNRAWATGVQLVPKPIKV